MNDSVVISDRFSPGQPSHLLSTLCRAMTSSRSPRILGPSRPVPSFGSNFSERKQAQPGTCTMCGDVLDFGRKVQRLTGGTRV